MLPISPSKALVLSSEYIFNSKESLNYHIERKKVKNAANSCFNNILINNFKSKIKYLSEIKKPFKIPTYNISWNDIYKIVCAMSKDAKNLIFSTQDNKEILNNINFKDCNRKIAFNPKQKIINLKNDVDDLKKLIKDIDIIEWSVKKLSRDLLFFKIIRKKIKLIPGKSIIKVLAQEINMDYKTFRDNNVKIKIKDFFLMSRKYYYKRIILNKEIIKYWESKKEKKQSIWESIEKRQTKLKREGSVYAMKLAKRYSKMLALLSKLNFNFNKLSNFFNKDK